MEILHFFQRKTHTNPTFFPAFAPGRCLHFRSPKQRSVYRLVDNIRQRRYCETAGPQRELTFGFFFLFLCYFLHCFPARAASPHPDRPRPSVRTRPPNSPVRSEIPVRTGDRRFWLFFFFFCVFLLTIRQTNFVRFRKKHTMPSKYTWRVFFFFVIIIFFYIPIQSDGVAIISSAYIITRTSSARVYRADNN